jgi:F0F1-type ATP synthase epsilon subunit
MNKQGTLNVIARAPFTVYYEGEATAVSALNLVGPFDVLPGHADFFSVLEPGQVIVEVPNGDPISFDINAGIITARSNEVHLFVNM